MPKAPIHKNNRLLLKKNNIRSSQEYLAMKPITGIP